VSSSRTPATPAKSVKLFCTSSSACGTRYDDMTTTSDFSTGEVEIVTPRFTTRPSTRAPRPLCIYHVNAPVSSASTPTGRRSSASTTDSRADVADPGPAGQFGGQRWQPVGSHALACSSSRRRETFRLRPGYVEKPTSEKWEEARDHKQEAGTARSSKQFLDGRAVEACSRQAPGTTGRNLLSAFPDHVARTRSSTDGNIWKPLPVHGHLQHVALGLVSSRRASGPEWLPRFEPGLLGFVHPRPLARGGSASSTSPPTQFADREARTTSTSRFTKRGNNDVGSGFNDDPLWLIFGVAAYIKETGDTAFSGARPLRQRPRRMSPTSSST